MPPLPEPEPEPEADVPAELPELPEPFVPDVEPPPSEPVELPVGTVVLSSEELHEPALPGDTTVWLRTS